MKYIYLFVLFFILVVYACKKEEDVTPESDPPMSIIPSIELKSVTPTSVKQFKDSIVFNIFYKDGDGDLGFSDTDSLSLYLTDNRVPLTEKYHVPPLSPDSSKIAIQGYFNLVLNHTNLLDTAGTDSETTTYTIKVKDRSGNWSNEVTSVTITINP